MKAINRKKKKNCYLLLLFIIVLEIFFLNRFATVSCDSLKLDALVFSPSDRII